MAHRPASRLAAPTGVWLGLVCALVCACGGAAPTAPDSVSPSSLRETPTSIAVEGRTLTLEAFLWRDFFPPISPPDGSPMIAVLRVQTSDGSPVPPTVTVDMAWLVRGTEVWSVVPREERAREEGAPKFEVLARDGPKWDVGAVVDVIVRLRTRGGVMRLRAGNQVVRTTF